MKALKKGLKRVILLAAIVIVIYSTMSLFETESDTRIIRPYKLPSLHNKTFQEDTPHLTPLSAPQWVSSRPPNLDEISQAVEGYSGKIQIYTHGLSFLGNVADCPINCHIGNQTSDVVLMHTKDNSSPNAKIRISAALEIYSTHPAVSKALTDDLGSYFQIVMHHHLSTDDIVVESWNKAKRNNTPMLYVPVTLPHYSETEMMRTPVSFVKKLNKIVAFPNCGDSVSNSMIRKLMEEMPGDIDLFGDCFQSDEDFAPCKEVTDKIKRKACIMSHYKFTLAFEDSAEISYVTEDFFHALYAGSVPVVWGALNVDEFDPLYHTSHQIVNSIINAKNRFFQELAVYLKLLMVNRDAYEEHLAWKTLGLGKHFKEILNARISHNAACNLCKAVAYIKKYT